MRNERVCDLFSALMDWIFPRIKHVPFSQTALIRVQLMKSGILVLSGKIIVKSYFSWDAKSTGIFELFFMFNGTCHFISEISEISQLFLAIPLVNVKCCALKEVHGSLTLDMGMTNNSFLAVWGAVEYMDSKLNISGKSWVCLIE